jgi:hypothetical protein
MRLRLAVIALAAFGALSLPAQAGADVRSELGQASAALRAAIDAGDAGDAAGLSSQIAANAAHTDEARRLVRSISSWNQRSRWLARVGQQYEKNLTEYLFEVGFVDPSMQPMLVDAFAANLEARERVVDSLARMLIRLPEAAQGRALGAIASLEAAGDVELMVDTVIDEEVGDEARQLVHAQVAGAVAHIQATIDRLDGLADRLPPRLHAYVRSALDKISAEVDGIQDVFDDLVEALTENFDADDGFDYGPLCSVVAGMPIAIQVPVCD